MEPLYAFGLCYLGSAVLGVLSCYAYNREVYWQDMQMIGLASVIPGVIGLLMNWGF